MKKINRTFANFLRSSGFRGPPEEMGFGLSPNLQPVAVLAYEPESLPQYFVSYEGVGLVGANTVILEIKALVPIRVRRVYAAATGAVNQGLHVSGGSLITAGAAAATIQSSDGSVSLCLAQSGQAAAPPQAGNYPVSAGGAVVGVGFMVAIDPFVVPEGRVVSVGTRSAVAGVSIYVGVSWEELARH